MINTLIFGGTTEGRLAVLKEPDAVVCVTTAYARSLLPPGTDCRVGRLDSAAMHDLMSSLRPRRVIDAAHPFAVIVHELIAQCCRDLEIPLIRMERPRDDGDWRSMVRSARDAREAALLAAETDGPIFLTTGSHTLSAYTERIPPERLFVRVLPTVESLTLCQAAGILPNHIIAMQGPFSRELNAALYDDLQIQTMVTKDSGAAGGLAAKVEPALARGIEIILIERPQKSASDTDCTNVYNGGQNAR